MSNELKIFSDHLKAMGLKTTRQRLNILESFLSASGHISAYELHSLIKKKYQGIGFSTVYRTLKLLTDCGIASEVNFGEGQSRFEKAFRREYHGHLICKSCGLTEEFSAASFQKAKEEISKKHGFKPTGFKIEIYGICRKCRKT